MAFDLEQYQFMPPDWMLDACFEIIAKIPPGTTKSQFHEMQKHLLEERFKLVLHWEPKERTIYELSIDQNGLKMHESAPDAPPAETEWSAIPGYSLDADKYPVFPPGVMGLMSVNNYARWRSSNVTMPDLVKVLRRQVRSDVIDSTGLKGKYDIDMFWQQRPIEIFPNSPPFVTPIEGVIQKRLGLKLQQKKGVVSIPVIDHLERKPTEN